MRKPARKRAHTFQLSPKARTTLVQLTNNLGVSQAVVLENALEWYAHALAVSHHPARRNKTAAVAPTAAPPPPAPRHYAWTTNVERWNPELRELFRQLRAHPEWPHTLTDDLIYGVEIPVGAPMEVRVGWRLGRGKRHAEPLTVRGQNRNNRLRVQIRNHPTDPHFEAIRDRTEPFPLSGPNAGEWRVVHLDPHEPIPDWVPKAIAIAAAYTQMK